jgi:hypothetical protein
VHPVEGVNILSFYAQLSRDNVLEWAYFNHLLSSMPYQFEQFRVPQQEKLRQIIAQLDEVRRMHLEIKLGLRVEESLDVGQMLEPMDNDLPISHPPQGAVRAPSHRSQVFGRAVPESYSREQEFSAIFRAIAREDLRELERLLGISSPTPSHQHVIARGSCFSFAGFERAGRAMGRAGDVAIDNKRTANHLVSLFLGRTDSEALKYLIQHSHHDYFERLLRACGKHGQYQFAIEHKLHPILLYLPLKELNGMISDLIGLGFYRDHRATLSLIDALQLRKLSNCVESESIFAMQNDLMGEAIRHHKQHHRYVTAILERHHASLHVNEMVGLLEVVNEQPAESLQCLAGPAMELAHDIPRANQVEMVRRPAVFVEDSLMNSDGTPNTRAYYSSETVNKLLSLKLAGKPEVGLFAPIDYAEIPNGAVMLTRLLEFLGNHEGPLPSKMLFPICIHNHWVGLMIEVKGEGVELTYYDSLSTKPYRNIVKTAAESAVKEIYAGFSVCWRESGRYQQEDGYSCGAYLVENILHDLSSLSGYVIPKKASAERWRVNHLGFLQINDEAYYAKHLQMAQEREGLSAQRGRVGEVVRPSSIPSRESLFRGRGLKRPAEESLESMLKRDNCP